MTKHRSAWTEPGDRFDRALDTADYVTFSQKPTYSVTITEGETKVDCDHGPCQTDSTICGKYGMCDRQRKAVVEYEIVVVQRCDTGEEIKHDEG